MGLDLRLELGLELGVRELGWVSWGLGWRELKLGNLGFELALGRIRVGEHWG